MKIVLFHNYYQLPGGEDCVVQAEQKLLQSHGHDVDLYAVKNKTLENFNFFKKFKSTLWNQDCYHLFLSYLKKEKPDIIHLHNDFPLASPAIIHAAHVAGVPIIQTLHNYRQMCANGLLSRKGKACEECIGKNFGWPAIVHKCYRDGYLASFAGAMRNFVHYKKKTWTQLIHGFIAPTEFVKQKYVDSGIDPSHIIVKPHFVEKPGTVSAKGGGFGLVIGRLTPEKGVDQILEIYDSDKTLPPIKFVGRGPLKNHIEEMASKDQRISFEPWADASVLAQLYDACDYVICAARVYETFGRVIAEAFSHGKPVVCPSGGAFEELVEDHLTGCIYDPNAGGQGLSQAIKRMTQLLKQSPQTIQQRCYETYRRRFSAEQNYHFLIKIYRDVLSGKLVGSTGLTVEYKAA